MKDNRKQQIVLLRFCRRVVTEENIKKMGLNVYLKKNRSRTGKVEYHHEGNWNQK